MKVFQKGLALLITGGLLYVMLSPQPATGGSIQGIDKIAHFGAFAIISGCFSILFSKWGLPVICLLALALGGGVEIIQGQIGRDSSWYDFTADGAGIAAYWVADNLWHRRSR